MRMLRRASRAFRARRHVDVTSHHNHIMNAYVAQMTFGLYHVRH